MLKISIPQASISKKINVGLLFTECVFLTWCILLFLQVFTRVSTSVFSQNLEFTVDIINIILTFKFCYKTNFKKAVTKFSALISIIGLFLVDIWYFLVYSSPHLSSYVEIFDTIHLLWYFTTIIFLIATLIPHVFKLKSLISILGFLILIDITIFLFFSVHVHYIPNTLPTTRTIIQIIQSFCELIIFDIALLWLIYSINKGTSLIATGYILLAASEFMITSSYMSDTSKRAFLLDYSELIWFLGLILMMCGFTRVISTKTYNLKEWFKPSSSIRSRLTFWSFIVGYLSIIILFTVLHSFAIIDRSVFIFFPTIIMLHSLLVVYFSIQIGKAFEKPFILIQNHLESLLLKNREQDAIKFHIEEFINLQKYIESTVYLREEKDKLEKAFAEVAASVIHDICSPINAIYYAIGKLKEYDTNKKNTKIIENSIESIKNITSNLLTKYRKVSANTSIVTTNQQDESDLKSYVLIFFLIEQLIIHKEVEWNHDCKLSFHTENCAKKSWAYISPIQLKRALSNLLNNAYESLQDPNKEIKVGLKVSDYSIFVLIEDNGIGIPSDKLMFIADGGSLKHEGRGLGLTKAIDYFKSINGNLLIDSVEQKGTTIEINFPKSEIPAWFPRKISYNKNSKFIILDDEASTFRIWLGILTQMDIKPQFLLSVDELFKWLELNGIDDNIILFTDYNLHDDKYNGVNIITKLNIANSYLVTSHAEETWIQEIVTQNSIKLIPKAAIPLLDFNLQ